MSISGDYATPVIVNGYSCKNCTDVDYASKHIDPAHPQSGPYNIDAKSDPSRADNPAVKVQRRAQRAELSDVGGRCGRLDLEQSAAFVVGRRRRHIRLKQPFDKRGGISASLDPRSPLGSCYFK